MDVLQKHNSFDRILQREMHFPTALGNDPTHIAQHSHLFNVFLYQQLQRRKAISVKELKSINASLTLNVKYIFFFE